MGKGVSHRFNKRKDFITCTTYACIDLRSQEPVAGSVGHGVEEIGTRVSRTNRSQAFALLVT